MVICSDDRIPSSNDDVWGSKYENGIGALHNRDFEWLIILCAHDTCAFSTSSSFIFSPHVEPRLTVFTQGFRGNRRRSVIPFYCAHVHDVVLVASAAYIFMQIRCCIVRSRWLTLFLGAVRSDSLRERFNQFCRWCTCRETCRIGGWLHAYIRCTCAHTTEREWDQSCASRSRIVAPGHRHGDSFFLSRRSRIFRAAREFLVKSINSRCAIY